ncbi:hypothetical protein EDB19DRAFT_1707543 [Suillus lakei]|nr:hypothetical protein EDB19DRAFT_1707543 [Suillus lakei]
MPFQRVSATYIMWYSRFATVWAWECLTLSPFECLIEPMCFGMPVNSTGSTFTHWQTAVISHLAFFFDQLLMTQRSAC